ncbi:MAG: flagellar hook protein FlgE [Pseudomonadota bacterium]|nr:flagellar hook protein FlgE [Pseudomonadota bacterium]
MPFRLALSGLNAASADLSVTANNIANSSTSGFKESRAEFAELFAVSAQGVATLTPGNGVRVSDIAQQFSQGNIDFTDNSLDLAISGTGFFTVSDNGSYAYTRAGAFRTDAGGYVVNAQGQRLQVFPPVAGGGFNTGSMADLRLVTSESAPQATSNVELLANLPSDAVPPANPTFSPTDPTSFTRATSLTVYDSLGAAHTGTVYFVKDAAPGEWTTHFYIDGNDVGTTPGITFDNMGRLVDPNPAELNFPAYAPPTGAADMTITINVAGTTQYGSVFSVGNITQDGYTTGRLIGIDIDKAGVVQARFTNGRSSILGQVALSNFANPNGLQQLADTSWAETFGSGQALRGQAGSSGFGLVQSGALEASNVDITTQLVNMITAQRNFQANAKMISTSDAITQTIINIR